MRRGDETVVVDPEWLGIVPIGQSLELSWEDAQIDAVSLPRTALSRLLGADIDPEGLDVGRLTPESPAIVKLWRHLAACLVNDVLSNRELYESDMVRDQAVQALLGVTIEAFSISDTSEDDLSDRGILRRSEEFMLARIGEPISVSHIARAVTTAKRTESSPSRHWSHATTPCPSRPPERGPRFESRERVDRRVGDREHGLLRGHRNRHPRRIGRTRHAAGDLGLTRSSRRVARRAASQRSRNHPSTQGNAKNAAPIATAAATPRAAERRRRRRPASATAVRGLPDRGSV